STATLTGNHSWPPSKTASWLAMPTFVNCASSVFTSGKLKSLMPLVVKITKCSAAEGVMLGGKPAALAITPVTQFSQATAIPTAVRAPPDKPATYTRASSIENRWCVSCVIAFQESIELCHEALRELFEPTTIQPKRS